MTRSLVAAATPMIVSSATRLLRPIPRSGPIETAPFYAVAINLGDLGTKGGLKADAHARVLGGNGRPSPICMRQATHPAARSATAIQAPAAPLDRR